MPLAHADMFGACEGKSGQQLALEAQRQRRAIGSRAGVRLPNGGATGEYAIVEAEGAGERLVEHDGRILDVGEIIAEDRHRPAIVDTRERQPRAQ